MNTIISLCHFCEVHGPAVLFCTQEILLPKNINEQNEKLFLAPFLKIAENFERNANLRVKNNVCQKNYKPKNACDACQSFKKVTPGFRTQSYEKSKIYLSTQYPHEDASYKIVNQTCVQSISVEQHPGQSGPMFFGDEGGYYTFSFKFSLKDFQSRGFKRNYRINISSKDKVHILSSWDFLSRGLEGIYSSLKNEAEACFTKEHAHHGANVPGQYIPLPTSSSMTTFLPKNGKQRESQEKQSRSLVDITGNPNVFADLHRSFVLLLDKSSKRLQEKLIARAQHSFIDLNKIEETEEGFLKLFSKSMASQERTADATGSEQTIATFTHLRSLMKVLGLSTFTELLYHVIIGTQILIRAQDKEIIRSVIDCLKVLLPDGCKNVAYYTKDYETFRHCNFIGMPLLPLLPAILKPCLLLDMSGVHTLKKVPPDLEKCKIYECLRTEIEELLLRYYMVTFENVHLPSKIPTLLENIQKIILNECLDNSVVDLCLVSLREDWFNKAKTYYAFTKGGQRTKADVEKLLQVLGAHNEDKVILTFWMTALFPKECPSEK